jgi:hypothetical protein
VWHDIAEGCRRSDIHHGIAFGTQEEAACSVDRNRSCRKTRIDLEETGPRLTYKPKAVEAAAE